jgi:hypothetical protein
VRAALDAARRRGSFSSGATAGHELLLLLLLVRVNPLSIRPLGRAVLCQVGALELEPDHEVAQVVDRRELAGDVARSLGDGRLEEKLLRLRVLFFCFVGGWEKIFDLRALRCVCARCTRLTLQHMANQ